LGPKVKKRTGGEFPTLKRRSGLDTWIRNFLSMLVVGGGGVAEA